MNKHLTKNQQGTLPYVSLNQDNSLTYDYPILSDTLNPAVWAVVKQQGWNSNPDYLTKLEAAAVTSFPDNMFDGNTDITSFNELIHFTSLTALPDNCFRNCPNLVEITLSPSKQLNSGFYKDNTLHVYHNMIISPEGDLCYDWKFNKDQTLNKLVFNEITNISPTLVIDKYGNYLYSFENHTFGPNKSKAQIIKNSLYLDQTELFDQNLKFIKLWDNI